jgi:hypothetical protein
VAVKKSDPLDRPQTLIFLHLITVIVKATLFLTLRPMPSRSPLTLLTIQPLLTVAPLATSFTTLASAQTENGPTAPCRSHCPTVARSIPHTLPFSRCPTCSKKLSVPTSFQASNLALYYWSANFVTMDVPSNLMPTKSPSSQVPAIAPMAYGQSNFHPPPKTNRPLGFRPCKTAPTRLTPQ